MTTVTPNAITIGGTLPDATVPATKPLPSAMVLFLAAGAGLSVASLYYSQPILGVLGAEIGASDHQVGWVPTLTQLGYALGILFLAPLGDRYDRRRIILAKAVALVVALLMAAAAPSITVLLLASLATGISATLAQDIVPSAAHLAPTPVRGKVVGTVMTGLLLGIVLSRVVSGYVAEHFGWRMVFLGAAASILLFGLTAWRRLPSLPATVQTSYVALLRSLAGLWKGHAPLRRAALAQGLLAVGFSAFWSSLAVMLHAAPFHLGSQAAGAFGLAGAAGALAAPLAGRLADRRGAEGVTRLGAGLVALSFAAMFGMPFLDATGQLWLLAASAIGFDLGVQATLIAHQTIVYAIDPGARSRLNAVLFVSMFIGMATGSALGTMLEVTRGWSAVTALATVTACGALLTRLGQPRPPALQAELVPGE